MRKAISLAALLMGSAAPALSQVPGEEVVQMLALLALAGGRNHILASYSGSITYTSFGYSVTASVDRGVLECSGVFRTGENSYPIQGRGKLDLDLEINDAHEYQFTLHCPYPTGYNVGIQELAGSYARSGGNIDLNPASCDQRGRPKPGQSRPCTLIWPDSLMGGWNYPEEGAMTWKLCQNASTLDMPRRNCLPGPPPPPPPPPPAPPGEE